MAQAVAVVGGIQVRTVKAGLEAVLGAVGFDFSAGDF
jgi:hypothetical protein